MFTLPAPEGRSTLGVDVTRARRFLLVLAAAALAVAASRGLTGLVELGLYAGPLVLITGLLLRDRFVGEEWVHGRVLAAVRRPVARARQRWARGRTDVPPALLERVTDRLRGPPAHAAA